MAIIAVILTGHFSFHLFALIASGGKGEMEGLKRGEEGTNGASHQYGLNMSQHGTFHRLFHYICSSKKY